MAREINRSTAAAEPPESVAPETATARSQRQPEISVAECRIHAKPAVGAVIRVSPPAGLGGKIAKNRVLGLGAWVGADGSSHGYARRQTESGRTLAHACEQLSMTLPEDYWASFEHTVTDLAEYLEAVRVISAYQVATGTRFVWRGAVDASWALHSSLVRRYFEQNGRLPTERQLHLAEISIVEEARDWGLDWHSAGGRLTGLELLAAMQHFGTPTRLLDFTFNPLIALWFAVERSDGIDGRVFAIDFSERTVDRALAATADPWWFGGEPEHWSVRSSVWRPPPIETRMIRQDGCFLVGGTPVSTPGRNVRGKAGAWRLLLQSEVRRCRLA